MLLAVLTRTFASLARTWQRVLIVAIAMALLTSTVLGFFALVANGYGVEVDGGDVAVTGAGTLIALLAALAAQLMGNWSTLAGVRAASRSAGPLESIVDTARGAPRLLVASLLLAAVGVVFAAIHPVLVLAFALVMTIPWCIAVGAVATDPRSFGLGAMWHLGVRRTLRNLGLYVGALLALLLAAAFAAALVAGPVLALGGTVPDLSTLRDADGLRAYLEDVATGIAIGSVLATILLLATVPSLVWAVYATADGAARGADWDDDSDDAVQPGSELSPIVASLIESGPPASQAGARPRMQVPPRAPRAGRLPGPGEMTVAGVQLPAGALVRSVDSPTLELDALDAAPSSAIGAVVTPVTSSMWISAEPVASPATLWRTLAAGFVESGLWPVFVPERDATAPEPWFEERARRERDSVDASAGELLRTRLSDSLAGSPLASTALIASSGLARGELGRGSGRRTDALTAAFGLLDESRLALVGARRPADVLHRTAWPGSVAAGMSGFELAEVVASWEERYGAVLVAFEASTLTFAVLRPPTSLAEAIEVAAEHHATCPDQADGWGDDQTYAAALVDAPTWRLGWS